MTQVGMIIKIHRVNSLEVIFFLLLSQNKNTQKQKCYGWMEMECLCCHIACYLALLQRPTDSMTCGEEIIWWCFIRQTQVLDRQSTERHAWMTLMLC